MNMTVWHGGWHSIGGRLGRLALIALGIVVGQVVLYGPSLVGSKVLLPLDLLAQPGTYLPLKPGQAPPIPHNFVRMDLIHIGEPARQFIASELHAGRLPFWMPYQYGGVPMPSAKFSPFFWLLCGVQSPVVLAWAEMAIALLAGFGMYTFSRRVLRVGYWPATVVAWCYPLTGFFIFWQGYGLSTGAAWLPWLLLAVDRTVRQTKPWSAPCLALVTALLLADGRPDIAGQALLASGIYALWCFFDQYGRQWRSRRAVQSLVFTAAAWTLGFLLMAGQLLPTAEYGRTGARVMRRSAGEEERPPVGLEALPQTVLPDMYGSTQVGSLRIIGGNQLESSAVAYAGLLLTLWLAPLAWCSRRHRSINLLWLSLGVLALAWVLDIPGLVSLLRLPLLNMMSHNRFVFVASFCLVALAAVGLDVLYQGTVSRRWWFGIPIVLVTILLCWCAYRTVVLPEDLAKILDAVVHGRIAIPSLRDPGDVKWVEATFTTNYAVATLLATLALTGWLLVWFRVRLRPWCVPLLGTLLVADLLWFGYGRSEQLDWSLYYPRIPLLETLAKEADKTSSRVIGYNCLPAALSETHRLRDVRGYDAVDPARMLELLEPVTDPQTPKIQYAVTQHLIPKIVSIRPPGIIQLPPILDMLGVRYVIFRGTPPVDQGIHADFSGDDYWALTNPSALPRAFVPAQVEVLPDNKQVGRMAATAFDPHEVAFVETPLQERLPETCHGTARVVDEIPTKITVSLDMETPGLLVLSDLWDVGWHAYLDGRKVPILRTNYAVRGVEVPAGRATLQFRYEPASFIWGLRLAVSALLVTLGWLAVGLYRIPTNSPAVPVAKTPPERPGSVEKQNLQKQRRDRTSRR